MAQPKQDELPEFPLRGPFGGIQSEVSTEAIEQRGFANSENMMFYKGTCRVRPGITALPSQPKETVNANTRIMDLSGQPSDSGYPLTIAEQTWTPQGLINSGFTFGASSEAWVGISDFFTVTANRVQVAFTPTRAFQWAGNDWTQIAGSLSGTSTNRISTAVVGEKLCFSQGIDPVQIWDGSTSGFGPAAAEAVPAKYLVEYANHLLACNTVEAGGRAYQRVHWTGAGDPTDWTSLNAGQDDLFNDLGPITGAIKLSIYAYIFQQKGIVQVIATGNGLKPFYFNPITSASKGLVCPYSLAASGETTCAYVGKDNVYSFDGTTSSPFGDKPVQGGRVGARRRIFADLQTVDLNTVWGYVSSSINGNSFNAYWLTIPNIATWVYNFDEENWTRFTFASQLSVVGNFSIQGVVRIKDLIGPISQQYWTPNNQQNNNPFDAVFLGFADGTSAVFDFTGWSEMPCVIETGQLAMGDYRHEKTIKKVRLMYQDFGQSAIGFKITNEVGQQWTPAWTPTAQTTDTLIGTNTGVSKYYMFEPSITGMLHTISITIPPGQTFSFSELTPIYSLGGEQRRVS